MFGVATFSSGDRTVDAPLSHFNGGGFAGQFGASSLQSPWGSITLSFPDCASMRFTYEARAELTPPVPGGTGERAWTRLTGANGLACN